MICQPFPQQIEQGSSHLGAQMAYISSFESDFCSMVWIRLRKWPSLGLFSENDAFWLEGLKRLNPSAFFVFASLGWAFCSPVYQAQDFGMECGLLMIVIFVEMSSDRVGSFHFDIIKVFFPPFNKRSSHFANILFVALFASQYIYHVVDAAIDVFWTSVCTACRSACNWSWSFQFLTPFAVGVTHLLRRSFLSFSVWIGFNRLARTRLSRRFRFLRNASMGLSGNSSLHSDDLCKICQFFLMIFIKFGLSGL